MTNPTLAANQDVPGDVGSPSAPDDGLNQVAEGRSLTQDAWRDLRRRPLFIISAVIILVVVVMAVRPQLFTSVDPNAADLTRSNQGPQDGGIFGYDLQGYSVYARSIYGARYSLVVGLMSTLLTTLIGMTIGMIAGYAGGFLDSVLSRVGDVFLGLPFLLGAIVILTTFNRSNSTLVIVTLVIVSLTVLGWPVPARVMRSSVLQAKQNDYVAAARSMGAGTGRIMFKHLLPNALSASLVYASISLGVFIGAEATLSYLGVGLRSPVISWGVMINDSANQIRNAPHSLLFPAAFLTITVLAFVMLGDAVREAFDPKLR
ncbi:ABC transporter permease [Rhodococcus aerolatus]